MRFRLFCSKKRSRGPVHLADRHTLGSIDNKSARIGHQRNLAKIYLLFLDFPYGNFAGLFIFICYDQLHHNFQRIGECHTSLKTFMLMKFFLVPNFLTAGVTNNSGPAKVHILTALTFPYPQFKAFIFQGCGIVIIRYWKHAGKNFMQPLHQAFFGSYVSLQKLLIKACLNL